MTLYFLKLADSVGATHSIEVGAYSARFSNLILKLSSYKSIHAFEANPYVFAKYKKKMPKKINFVNLAISNKNGEINFYFKNYEKSIVGESNSLLEVASSKPNSRSILVQSATLDTLFPDSPKNILWIDVEGANHEVLVGGMELLKNTMALFIEVEHKIIWKNQWTSKDVHNFLVLKGFSLITIKRQDYHQSNSIYFKSTDLSLLQLLIFRPVSYVKMKVFEILSLKK